MREGSGSGKPSFRGHLTAMTELIMPIPRGKPGLCCTVKEKQRNHRYKQGVEGVRDLWSEKEDEAGNTRETVAVIQ